MNRPLLGMLLLVLAFGASAVAADKEGNLVIGFVGKSASNGAFKVAKLGADEAARVVGNQYGIRITIDDETPPKNDPAAQVAALKRLVLSGVDGISIACSDHNLITPAINDTVDAGIPVATFDSDAPDSKRFFCYLADDDQCGNTLMAELSSLLDGHGVVGVLGGVPTEENFRRRVRAIRNTATVYPNIVLRGVYYSEGTPASAAARIQAAMKANPDITGWACVGSWALSAPNAFPWPAGKVKCVTTGLLPSQLSYVRSGQVNLVLAEPYFQWGYRTVMRLAYWAKAHRAPPETVEYASLSQVTAANASEFEKTIMAGWDKVLPR